LWAKLRIPDDSINVRIDNLDGLIVGAIQFYNLHTYDEMILVEKSRPRSEPRDRAPIAQRASA
jgi:hypothetical protein